MAEFRKPLTCPVINWARVSRYETCAVIVFAAPFGCQGFPRSGSGAVWSRSLTSFEMTGEFNVSFRAHREKSFSSLENAIFELNHYPLFAFDRKELRRRPSQKAFVLDTRKFV